MSHKINCHHANLEKGRTKENPATTKSGGKFVSKTMSGIVENVFQLFLFALISSFTSFTPASTTTNLTNQYICEFSPYQRTRGYFTLHVRKNCFRRTSIQLFQRTTSASFKAFDLCESISGFN